MDADCSFSVNRYFDFEHENEIRLLDMPDYFNLRFKLIVFQ